MASQPDPTVLDPVAYSKLIAGLVGPLFVAMGIAMLVNHNRFPSMFGQMAQDQDALKKDDEGAKKP